MSKKGLFIFLGVSLLIHAILLFYATTNAQANFKIPDKIFAITISNVLPPIPEKTIEQEKKEEIKEVKEKAPAPKKVVKKQTPQKAIATNQVSKQYVQARTNYEQLLAAWLERYRTYPSRALRKKIEGEGILWAKINSQGKVLNYKLRSSTNSEVLDEAIIKMLNKADPLPAIPKELNLNEFQFAIPVSFKIN